jgi:hypothetical protein
MSKGTEATTKPTVDSEAVQSKASMLARELSIEKKRLQEELKELQLENEQLTPTTPIGTVDWYIKWFAVVTGVAGVFIMSAGLGQIGQIAYVLSSIAWIIVGIFWQDRAIMIGSSITMTAMLLDIIRNMT